MFRLEAGQRQAPEIRMGTGFVVVVSPLLDADLRVGAIPKPLKPEVLIAELAVEDSSAPFCYGLPGSMNAV